jgi:hypothetical protein
MKKIHWSTPFVLLIVATPVLAALVDHFDQSRVAKIEITCPLTAGSPCAVEVTRVRPLLPAFQAEANDLGLNMSAIPDVVVRRVATRAQLQTFLASISAP